MSNRCGGTLAPCAVRAGSTTQHNVITDDVAASSIGEDPRSMLTQSTGGAKATAKEAIYALDWSVLPLAVIVVFKLLP